jgi:hypothetical protein
MKPSHAWSRRDDSHAHQPGHVRAFAVHGVSLKSVKPRVSVPLAFPCFFVVVYLPVCFSIMACRLIVPRSLGDTPAVRGARGEVGSGAC